MKKQKRHMKRVRDLEDHSCEESMPCMQRIIAVNAACISNPPPGNNAEGNIIPIINRYFYIPEEDIDLTNGVTIPANLFYGDDGNPVTEFMLFRPNGYVNLYINAVMQEGGIYTVTTDSLTLNPYATTIFAGTPIILESLGFTTT
ncbi:hypothetical protein ABIA69_001089 [Lysinibacillus parviboronicapiens]|uniref:DUF4183 domain-containing protein n=2 Tax=Lysinibacillus parviboronicapiens TaxID=436516 RepID=A0ABV2PG74_9BACI|nr:DUF4183 domain-containing protein [Lysinibacillus parviboronicapiens]